MEKNQPTQIIVTSSTDGKSYTLSSCPKIQKLVASVASHFNRHIENMVVEHDDIVMSTQISSSSRVNTRCVLRLDGVCGLVSVFFEFILKEGNWVPVSAQCFASGFGNDLLGELVTVKDYGLTVDHDAQMFLAGAINAWAETFEEQWFKGRKFVK